MNNATPNPVYPTSTTHHNHSAINEIVKALHGIRNGTSWRCKCPVHGGTSLILSRKDDKILIHCFGGCSQRDVIDALRVLKLWDPLSPEALAYEKRRQRYELEDHFKLVMLLAEDLEHPSANEQAEINVARAKLAALLRKPLP